MIVTIFNEYISETALVGLPLLLIEPWPPIHMYINATFEYTITCSIQPYPAGFFTGQGRHSQRSGAVQANVRQLFKERESATMQLRIDASGNFNAAYPAYRCSSSAFCSQIDLLHSCW